MRNNHAVWRKRVANLALAPQIIGILSDQFRAHTGAGAESLRWALVLTTVTGFWAAYHFWAAARNMRHDLERAGTIQPKDDARLLASRSGLR